MNTSQEYKLTILKDRALMMQKARSFFLKRNILEVDPFYLMKHPTIDLHIDSIKAHPYKKDICYLHTSPEYMLKRMISKGLKDIFFLGHVFRKNEIGRFHNVEFTMIEWYKSSTNFKFFINENIKLLKLFIKFKKFISISYSDLFLKNFNIDIFKLKNLKKGLLKICKKLNISFSNIKLLKKENLLNLLLDYFFSSLSKKDHLYMIYDFPENESALAKVLIKNNKKVAKRFEFFFNNLEIANGYFELNDENILRKRFEKILKKRKKLSLDENFLKSINHLGSNCFGIAIGFDRLMMLRHKTKDIKDVFFCSYKEL